MVETQKKVRAFVAIHPSAEVLHRLEEIVEQLKEKLGSRGLKWVKPEQLHLTLQFLGSVSENQIEATAEALQRVTGEHGVFALEARNLGCFPSPARPRVLWIGLSGETQRLSELKTHLDGELSVCGYQPEARPFHPHITLARISELPSPSKKLFRAELDSSGSSHLAGKFMVEKISLIKSTLRPGGAEYETLAEGRLNPT